jgi:hypothetical protein
MARVQIAAQPWGVIVDQDGNVREGITPTVTGLDSSPVTVYAASTGGTAVTSLATNARGEIPGWIDEGSYLLTTSAGSYQVEALQGAASLARAASVADASTSTKGVSRLSVAPASPTVPIAVGDNDPRVTGASQGLVPTAVKTAGYTAATADFVPVDTTAGAVTVTLPSAPPDRTRIGVKHVIQGGTNAVTVARGGADLFNKAGGSTSLSLGLLNQAVVLQYAATAGLWYVQSADLPQVAADARYQQAAVYGLLANRPTAAAAGDRSTYFATDDNGGTLYQVQSAAWVKIAASAAQAGGAELGYAEVATNPTSTSTYPTRTDVTGLSITTPSLSGAQAIKVIFDCADLGNSSTGGAVLSIMEGAAELQFASTNTGAGINIPVHREVRLTPSAGSHTYKIAISRLSAAGTVTLVGSGTPAFIQAVGC